MNSSGICSLTIAGPGAGKTTQMINDIEKSLESLESHRFCVVITYTNEAKKEIQKRLRQRVKLPSNLFVGTIHSFLINFLIEPYAHLYEITPVEKVYIDEIKLPFKASNIYIEKNCCINRADELLGHGLITFDKILEKSFHLTTDNRVCNIVANKLQYIFIDEYQDSRVLQHRIMLNILEKGKTNIYAIGDPMQSIFHFTYSQSQLRSEPKPDDKNLPPIIDLKKICDENNNFDCKELNENRRCSPQITSFINNFNACIVQITEKADNGVPVYYINETNLEKVIEYFFYLKEKHKISLSNDTTISNLFLSRKRDTFSSIENNANLTGISNNGCDPKSIFIDAERCILSLLGTTVKSLINDYGIDKISFRKFVIKKVKEIRIVGYEDSEINELKKDIIQSFNDEFNVLFKPTEAKSNIGIDSSLKNTFLRTADLKCSPSLYSTIHSAKGLEASSVLVVAETKNLFKKWIKTNPDNILDANNDEARLGFVGFSRAIDFLCVACLEEAADLIKFPDVEVYPQPDGRRQFKLTDF